MIWLAWRQFRFQAVVAAAALVAVAAYLVMLGTEIRDTYDGVLAQCNSQGDCAALMGQFQSEYTNLLLFLDAVPLILVPLLLGMFWGAPLIAREFEAGTHRLVWNQSVTRPRWLAVKLLSVGLASAAVAGLVSLLLTWAAGPVDHVAGDRFSGIVFGARNVAPVASAVFAFVLGAVIGMIFRRTLPAMALTLVAVVAVQIAVPNLIRPYLMTPITVSVPMTAEAIVEDTRGLGNLWNEPVVKALSIPDAWVTSTSVLLTSDGQPLDIDRFDACIAPGSGGVETAAECLGVLDLHVEASYQPNDRYWAFQWIESAIFLALSTLLAAFGLWRVRRSST